MEITNLLGAEFPQWNWDRFILEQIKPAFWAFEFGTGALWCSLSADLRMHSLEALRPDFSSPSDFQAHEYLAYAINADIPDR